jgi:hypothetical protein
MAVALNAFENHAVAVLDGFEACAQGCAEIARLGLSASDVGVVLSARELERAGERLGASAAAGSSTLDGGMAPEMGARLMATERIFGEGEGWALFACSGYPGELIRTSASEPSRAENSVFDGGVSGVSADGRASAGHAFAGLLSEREGRALLAAILRRGAALWVRTRSPAAAQEVAALMLRISAERVRTFNVAPADPGLHAPD